MRDDLDCFYNVISSWFMKIFNSFVFVVNFFYLFNNVIKYEFFLVGG